MTDECEPGETHDEISEGMKFETGTGPPLWLL